MLMKPKIHEGAIILARKKEARPRIIWLTEKENYSIVLCFVVAILIHVHRIV